MTYYLRLLRDTDGDQKKKEEELPTSYCYSNCATTENIREWVLALEDVETHSTSIYN